MRGRAPTIPVWTLFLLAAGQALAEDSGPSPRAEATSPEEGLPEIQITATRQATGLQHTSIATTAVTAQQLTDRGITNVGDLGSLVPNSQFLPVQGAFGPGISAFIRGIGSGDTSLGGNRRSPST